QASRSKTPFMTAYSRAPERARCDSCNHDLNAGRTTATSSAMTPRSFCIALCSVLAFAPLSLRAQAEPILPYEAPPASLPTPLLPTPLLPALQPLPTVSDSQASFLRAWLADGARQGM